MPVFFTDEEHAVIAAACERLVPPLEEHPGAGALGVADFIDGLLGAFAFDPPRIWAGGPFSGRHGGQAAFDRFLPLGRVEELAWRTRIEGSQGVGEREFNGPVAGWQQEYRDGIAALGTDFRDLPAEEQDARLDAAPHFKATLYRHACQGSYAAPEYGGNRECKGWEAIGFPGDIQPRGYTDAEVAGRD